MPSSAECGYTQSVCGHTGAGLRQAPRMRIAHVRMWAVAREYTIPQTIQMANRRVVGSRPHQISSPGSRDLRDLGQWDHDTSSAHIPLRGYGLYLHTQHPRIRGMAIRTWLCPLRPTACWGYALEW